MEILLEICTKVVRELDENQAICFGLSMKSKTSKIHKIISF